MIGILFIPTNEAASIDRPVQTGAPDYAAALEEVPPSTGDRFWQQSWFPWVAGTVAAVIFSFLLLLVICICWCLWKRRKAFQEKASAALGVPLNTNSSGNGNICGGNSGTGGHHFKLSPTNVTLPFISTQVSAIQPVGGFNNANTVNGIVVLENLTVINTPQLPTLRACGITDNRPSPLMGGLPVAGRRRGERRGLFESRRGSHTSLTLSLSSSADSIPSTLSGKNPQLEQDTLREAGAMLNPVQLKDKLQGASRNVLYKEFNSLPMNYATREDIGIQNVLHKTRYQLLPNEPTRVVLPLLNGDPITTFINANHIAGYNHKECAFIATEGPISNTIIDFWRMVWITNTNIIVMITDLVEKNRSKCEPYFPELDSQTYGSFQIHVQSVERRDGYCVRKMLIKNLSDGDRLIYHYWYTGWLDHTTPSTAPQLVQLMQDCRHLQQRILKQSLRRSVSPVLVHCSAGLGRTGCFIALWISCDQLSTEGQVDVLAIVGRLRLQRGGMVQNFEQYEFIHQALQYWWEKIADQSAHSRRSGSDHMNSSTPEPSTPLPEQNGATPRRRSSTLTEHFAFGAEITRIKPSSTSSSNHSSKSITASTTSNDPFSHEQKQDRIEDPMRL